MTEIPETIPHILACDAGNSSIHFAHVAGDQIGEVHVMRVGELANLGNELELLWQQIPSPKKLVACSVNAAVLKALEAAAQETLHEAVLVVGRDIPLPIDTNVDEPAAIGVDRLCAAVAAFDRLGVACVIADFGTAITIDCVNEQGVFMGGAILPGLEISAKCLNQETAQLPKVELSQPTWIFGKNTNQAIIGGLVYGARGALREFTETYATELGHWPTVIATGGDAKLVCGDVQESELVQAIVPDLVIRGVALSYYRIFAK